MRLSQLPSCQFQDQPAECHKEADDGILLLDNLQLFKVLKIPRFPPMFCEIRVQPLRKLGVQVDLGVQGVMQADAPLCCLILWCWTQFHQRRMHLMS